MLHVHLCACVRVRARVHLWLYTLHVCVVVVIHVCGAHVFMYKVLFITVMPHQNRPNVEQIRFMIGPKASARQVVHT